MATNKSNVAKLSNSGATIETIAENALTLADRIGKNAATLEDSRLQHVLNFVDNRLIWGVTPERCRAYVEASFPGKFVASTLTNKGSELGTWIEPAVLAASPDYASVLKIAESMPVKDRNDKTPFQACLYLNRYIANMAKSGVSVMCGKGKKEGETHVSVDLIKAATAKDEAKAAASAATKAENVAKKETAAKEAAAKAEAALPADKRADLFRAAIDEATQRLVAAAEALRTLDGVTLTKAEKAKLAKIIALV